MSEFEPKHDDSQSQQENSTNEENRNNSNRLIRETMQVYLDEADSLKNSEEIYKQESFSRALSKVNELNLYKENGILTQEEVNIILALELAKTEMNGLIDPLTQSLNEPGINARLASSISHIRRHSDENLSVAYFDLVGFKEVNDTIGHDAGDKVLAYFHFFITEQMREEDYGGRLHGDEFFYAFPTAEESMIKQKFSKELIEDQLSAYVNEKLTIDGIDTKGINIRARVGVTSYLENDSVDSLKKRADDEMNAQREKQTDR